MLKVKDTRWKKSGEEKRVTVNCNMFDIKPLTLVMATSDDSLNHIYRKQSLQDLQSILCNMKSLQLQWLFNCGCYKNKKNLFMTWIWKCSKLDGYKTWYCHLNGNWVQMYGYRITICEQKQSIYRNCNNLWTETFLLSFQISKWALSNHYNCILGEFS